MIFQVTETGPTEDGHHIVDMGAAMPSSMVDESDSEFEEPVLLLLVRSVGRGIFNS